MADTGCNSTFLAYANNINNNNGSDSASTDVVPCLQLFSADSCNTDQTTYPGITVSNPFTQGQTITNGVAWSFTVVGFFIPFNFSVVTMTSTTGGYTVTYHGPYYVVNTANWTWPGSNNTSTMRANPIATITFGTILDWDSSLVLQCMGNVQSIAQYPLTRYMGQGARCDYFMSTDWCVAPRLANTECGCFKDLPTVEAEATRLGVSLPVICFGEACATGNTYRTFAMQQFPCNLTICSQIVKESPGIVDTSTNTVFCGGQFYNSLGSVVAPSISVTSSAIASQAASSWYTWVMLGASGLIMIVLVALLFVKRPEKQSSLLTQIRQIKADRKAIRRQTPPPPPVEDNVEDNGDDGTLE